MGAVILVWLDSQTWGPLLTRSVVELILVGAVNAWFVELLLDSVLILNVVISQRPQGSSLLRACVFHAVHVNGILDK